MQEQSHVCLKSQHETTAAKLLQILKIIYSSGRNNAGATPELRSVIPMFHENHPRQSQQKQQNSRTNKVINTELTN
jgi:hypothetical protein